MEILIGAITLWIVPIFVANAIGRPKNRAGLLYGLFLGWLGVIVLALLPPAASLTLDELERKRANVDPKWYEKRKAELLAAQVNRECPHCKEQMRRDASVCPHCQRESASWTLHEGHWWSYFDGSWHQYNELTNNWLLTEETASQSS